MLLWEGDVTLQISTYFCHTVLCMLRGCIIPLSHWSTWACSKHGFRSYSPQGKNAYSWHPPWEGQDPSNHVYCWHSTFMISVWALVGVSFGCQFFTTQQVREALWHPPHKGKLRSWAQDLCGMLAGHSGNTGPSKIPNNFAESPHLISLKTLTASLKCWLRDNWQMQLTPDCHKFAWFAAHLTARKSPLISYAKELKSVAGPTTK